MTEVARVVRGEVVHWLDAEPTRRQPVCHPHPLAREAYDRPLLLETLADLGTWWPAVRWLVVAASAGTTLALSAPTWVWWTVVPAGVAWAVDVRLPRDSFSRAVQLGLSTEPDEVRDG